MAATRTIPGSGATRIVPTPESSGSTPPSPPAVTLPNDTTLVEHIDVTGAQAVGQKALASGWSY